MPDLGQVGERNYLDGSNPSVGLRIGQQGDQTVSTLHGRYYEQALRGRVFSAHAIVTAPVIYTTAAGTGGPLLYNGSTTHNAVILAAGWGSAVVTTVAATIGLTGGPTTAPSSTTAIDSKTNGFLGAGAGAMSLYRVGTVSAAGTFFHPLGDVNTGALTTRPGSMNWVDLGGIFVVPPGYFISIAASATASTLVANFGLVWEEVPIRP